MLSIRACREIFAAAGTTDLTDAEIEHLRYVLAQVARLQFRQQFGVEVALPPPPAALPQ